MNSWSNLLHLASSFKVKIWTTSLQIYVTPKRFWKKIPGRNTKIQPCIVFGFSFCSNFIPVLKMEVQSGGYPLVTVTFLFTTTTPPRFLVTQRWRMNSRPCRKNHLSRVESRENLVTMLVFRNSGKGVTILGQWLKTQGRHWFCMGNVLGLVELPSPFEMPYRDPGSPKLFWRWWRTPQSLSDNMTSDAYEVGPGPSQKMEFFFTA